MKNFATRLMSILLLAFLLTSCRYDVKEEINGIPGECDTESRSFSLHIVPIFEANCYQCHASDVNLGNITLEGYDAVKSVVDSERLLGSVKRDNGFSPMPQGADVLPACEISSIEAWIQQGAPNN